MLGVAGVMLVAATLALVHGAGTSTTTLSEAAVLVGRPAPEIAIAAADGHRVSLTDLRGRPAVVNFWASWCASCRLEADQLNRSALLEGDRAGFLGVDIQDSASAASGFEAQHPHLYPTGPAVTGSYLRYGVSAPPETFFIDSRGVVVRHVIGPLDAAGLNAGLRQAGA